MASIKGRLTASMAPVAAIIGEPSTEDRADQVDRLLRMYDACQAGQTRLRDILPHAKGDERMLVLICRYDLLQFSAAILTPETSTETITKMGLGIVRNLEVIGALPGDHP